MSIGGTAPTGGAGNGGRGGAQATCAGSQSALKAGDATISLQSGGRARSYIQHVPSGLTAGVPLAVLIDLHGAGGNGKQQQGLSGFNSLADKEKFLAIFPNGVDGYWNVDDTCCGTAGKEKIDDVGFLKAIITKLSAETCIDAKRILCPGSPMVAVLLIAWVATLRTSSRPSHRPPRIFERNLAIRRGPSR